MPRDPSFAEGIGGAQSTNGDPGMSSAQYARTCDIYTGSNSSVGGGFVHVVLCEVTVCSTKLHLNFECFTPR